MACFRALYIVVAAASFVACAANARAQVAPACTSSVTVPFNAYGDTHVPAGSTLWFSSVLEGVDGVAALGKTPIRIDVRNARITFGRWPYVVKMPDSTIALDPTSTNLERWWQNDAWSLTYAPAQIPEAFFDGVPYAIPEPFVPAFSGPVTMTATFTASRPGVTVRWAWSAAAYSQFGANGRLLVKPLTAPVPQFANSDPAGTPELYKQYVVAGAMGSGAPQYTGARSDVASVAACTSANPPPPSAPTAPTAPVRPRGAVVLVWHGSMNGMVVGGPVVVGSPVFAGPVAQMVTLPGGSVAAAVEKCFALDLCATISYNSGDRLSIYYGGAVRCEPSPLYFEETSRRGRLFGFSRHLDYDESVVHGRRCATTRTTRIVTAGGRLELIIGKNADGSLHFRFRQR